MMEHRPLDPYEQQLLKVFDSYDFENKGSLDRDGLTQLCQTLQLEEQGNELIKCLLTDPKHSRATFTEFKDALLALLGNLQNSDTSQIDGSPEREVSPKFVYGSKKYGRRSRPRSDEISPIKEHDDVKFINNTVIGMSVQRSNSQSEVLFPKKRKTNGGSLKRCISYPGNNLLENDQEQCDENFLSVDNFNNSEFVCTESMLREAWKKLGVGKDGYLNQTELILVCDAIGLSELANGVLRQLSDKLLNDFDHKISFQELLEVLQRDEAWFDVLNSTTKNDTVNLTCISDDSIFLNSKSVQYVTLGPKGNGYISIDTVIELWEMAGITAPKILLNDLGFNSNDIDIIELASVLEKEIKGIQETRSDFSNPHIALLQAILALYQSEIRCLKNILEQMQAEREKLKSDISEANNRATLLAQEVDDNHAKMEKSTLKQVRLLEQRHTEILKEISEQCTTEKDQLTTLNKNLEQRIANLESEESKLRNDLNLAQKYLNSVEKENQNLSTQVVELEHLREILNEQVKNLEAEKLKCHESEQIQMESLLEQLSSLQLENSRLRDRNDEMQAEIENLMRSKSSAYFNLDNSMDDNLPAVCEGVGHGSKRRSDESPSKDLSGLGLGVASSYRDPVPDVFYAGSTPYATDASPRLGKVRKFHKNKDILDIPFTSSESGFETELDCLDSSLSNSSSENEELIVRLQAKVEALEQILADHSIPISSDFSTRAETDAALLKVRKLAGHSHELESLLIELKDDINRLYVRNANSEEIRHINEKFERLTSTSDLGVGAKTVKDFVPASEYSQTRRTKRNDASTETENNDDLQNRLRKCENENEALKTKCEDLEVCLKQLENEYVNCEKYWENTLEEERRVFEVEQTQYSDHLIHLTDKIAEYEKEFVEKNSRLPPIEERRHLEDQFTDLEQEFEDYKEQTEFQMDEKDREIADLKEKIEELQVTPKDTAHISTQTELEEPKVQNLSNHVIESTNFFSADTMPYTLSVQSTTEQASQIPLLSINPIWTENVTCEESMDASVSLPVTVSVRPPQENVKQSLSMFDIPSSSTEKGGNCSQKMAPLRPKRMRKHDRNMSQRLYKKTVESQHCENSNKWNGTDDLRNCSNDDRVMVPISTVHNMNARIHHLEQRCRHLQLVIKQQHYYAEQVLQHCSRQHVDEKMHLQFLLKTTQEKLDRQMKLCNDQLERLAKNDLLVKDIYVENAFLLANVQRLEQECHLLSQCNSTNSV